MPSERRWLALLRSQGLGLACAGATVLLLAVGSVVLAVTADGASSGVQLDDVRAFFDPVSPWHLWLYLLLPVLGLYGLNTLLCTWDSVVRRWRRGLRSPAAYATALVHLGFLVALAAHAAGGLWGTEGPPLLLGSRWSTLGQSDTQARLLAVDEDLLPGGMPRQVSARLELRRGTRTWRETVAYNAPITSGLGSRLLLLARPLEQPAATVELGGGRCVVTRGAPCRVSGRQIHLMGFHAAGHWGSTPLAILLVVNADGSRERVLGLQGHTQRLSDGTSVRVAKIAVESLVLLRDRRAPGTPLALVAAVVLLVGLGLMGRRWL